MKKLIGLILIASLLIGAGYASAATFYSLPDPGVIVNPNFGNTTTIVTVAGKTYRGASNFVYFSECTKPDAVRYRCNIMTEDDVILVASDGSVARVSLTVQFASTLIVSGHNYWRNSQTVLAGELDVL